MISTTDSWLRKAGFCIWHFPGISRAWRFEFDDGGCVLITNLEGYDLPVPGGPFTGIALTRKDELIETQPSLRDAKELTYWFRHVLRLYASEGRKLDRISENEVDVI